MPAVLLAQRADSNRDSVLDISTEWTRAGSGLTLCINNAMNRAGYASGHVVAGEARYYVPPPLNLFLLARIGM